MVDITFENGKTTHFPWWILIGIIIVATTFVLAKGQAVSSIPPEVKAAAASPVKPEVKEYKVKVEDDRDVRVAQVQFLKAGNTLKDAVDAYNQSKAAVDAAVLKALANAGADSKTCDLQETADGKLVIKAKPVEEKKK